MFPILFHLGSRPVSTYGVLFALGAFAALILVVRQARLAGQDRGKMLTLACAAVVGGTVGAVFPGWVLGQWGLNFLSGRWAQLGTIGAIAAGSAAARWVGVPILDAFDIGAAAGALAHGIGRLGCFAAGCCYGKPASLPWSVVFRDPEALRESGTPIGIPLHPTQLYEAFTEITLSMMLAAMYVRPHRRGSVLGLYLVVSSVIRFGIEYARAHTAEEMGPVGLSLAQWLAIALALWGAALLARGREVAVRAISRSAG